MEAVFNDVTFDELETGLRLSPKLLVCSRNCRSEADMPT
jgi:hypothetical protein